MHAWVHDKHIQTVQMFAHCVMSELSPVSFSLKISRQWQKSLVQLFRCENFLKKSESNTSTLSRPCMHIWFKFTKYWRTTWLLRSLRAYSPLAHALLFVLTITCSTELMHRSHSSPYHETFWTFNHIWSITNSYKPNFQLQAHLFFTHDQ